MIAWLHTCKYEKRSLTGFVYAGERDITDGKIADYDGRALQTRSPRLGSWQSRVSMSGIYGWSTRGGWRKRRAGLSEVCSLATGWTELCGLSRDV
jgi:hypothetical protein